MVDRDITLFGLHLHNHGDVDLGGIDPRGDRPRAATDGGSQSDAGPRPGRTAALVGIALAVCVGLAGVAWMVLRRTAPR